MWGSMHSDFRGAAKKLERENKERSQRAKLKSSKDQAEKERVKQRLAAHEDDQRQRRLAELYAQEQVSAWTEIVGSECVSNSLPHSGPGLD